MTKANIRLEKKNGLELSPQVSEEVPKQLEICNTWQVKGLSKTSLACLSLQDERVK